MKDDEILKAAKDRLSTYVLGDNVPKDILESYHNQIMVSVKAAIRMFRMTPLVSTSHLGSFKYNYKRGLEALEILESLGILREIQVRVDKKAFKKIIYYLIGYEDLINIHIDYAERLGSENLQFEWLERKENELT